MQLTAGTILDGRVTGITKFGAFVALPEGKSGLIHISEVADAYVNDINEYLSVGQTVTVRVLSIGEDGKIRLSARQGTGENRAAAKAAPRPAEPVSRPAQPRPRPAEANVPESSGDRAFEDKLKQFMQDANSKMSGSRLYEQQKKSRSRKK